MVFKNEEVTFELVGDSSISILHGPNHVGDILYNTKPSESVLDRAACVKEFDVLMELIDSESFHIEQIETSEEHAELSLFNISVALAEEVAKSLNQEKVTLFCSPSLVSRYTGLGYKMKCAFSLIPEVLMYKELDLSQRMSLVVVDDYAMVIKEGLHEVGRISMDNLLPQNLLNSLTEEEYKKVISFSNPTRVMHLNYITIYPDYRGDGRFIKALELFEDYVMRIGMSGISLLSPQHLLDVYSTCGYLAEFLVESQEHHLMTKELRAVVVEQSNIF